MLQPLKVTAPPAPPTLGSHGSLSMMTQQQPTQTHTDGYVRESRTPLAKVCAIENLTVPHKSKSNRGGSLYVIKLYMCVPGRPNAMLAPSWRIGADLEFREPDSVLGKKYPTFFKLYDQLKTIVTNCKQGKPRCRLCGTMYSFFEDRDTTPHGLNRIFMGDQRKCELIQELLGKFVHFLVRAQYPARPNTPFEPSCDNQSIIADFLATFLEL